VRQSEEAPNLLSVTELIDRCTQASPEQRRYWTEFNRRFDEQIIIFTLRYLRRTYNDKIGKQKLDDVKQDVFVRLAKDNAKILKAFRGKTERELLGYLSIICKSTTLNYLRAEKKRAQRNVSTTHNDDDREGLEMDISTHDTTDELSFSETKDHIVQLLRTNYYSRKFERDLTIFKLYYFNGMTTKEIGEFKSFGLSASGIETLISRMKKAIENEKY